MLELTADYATHLHGELDDDLHDQTNIICRRLWPKIMGTILLRIGDDLCEPVAYFTISDGVTGDVMDDVTTLTANRLVNAGFSVKIDEANAHARTLIIGWNEPLKDRISRLIARYQNDHKFDSVPCPEDRTYKELVSLGRPAIPYLVDLIKQEPNPLPMLIMQDILGCGPEIPPESQGVLADMADIWTAWVAETVT